ncbi:MAG TPA: hypothetical protein VGE07_03640 [Herpetosiphonaceae bacterium]
MRTRDAQTAFETLLRDSRSPLDSLTIDAAIEIMATFYTTVPCDDCTHQQSQDMLLFQWGTYDWGAGPHFEASITRQLIPDPSPEELAAEIWDSAIFQLAVKHTYAPNPALDAVGRGSFWLPEPGDLPEFLASCQAQIECFAPHLAGQPEVSLSFNDVE